jgi:dihydrofolate reductase
LKQSSALNLSLIVAVAENGVIGRNGDLPWKLSSDLKTFRRLTMGKPLIMGRRTFESIGKPLDGRDNIVVTRDPHFEVPGVSACPTVDEALTLARVLAATRGADRIYFTEVHARPDGDRYFAVPDEDRWREVSREALPKGPKDEFASTLVVYERR